MLSFDIAKILNRNSKVLFLGAHCDDIEIGCGGTILSLISEIGGLDISWVIFSSDEIRSKEALDSANAFLSGAKNKNVLIENFRNGYFPSEYSAIKDYFETIKKSHDPEIIFTHYRFDDHQDHRVVNELTWNTFRNHHILEYEIPKYDGDLGNPNVYYQITQEARENKTGYLLKYFLSQHGRQWFSEDTFSAIMRLRGIESNSDTGYAEAFYARKILIG